MIRTQVYLTQQLNQSLDIISKQEKKPKAQIIREALEDGIKQKTYMSNAGKALLELAEFGKKLHIKGPKDLSTNIDKYLYEK
ncbi:MAG TPA: ribbon-helix-helix domain-containing protein [Patescibacteria group bacterium]|nr:ribbon-helix-helix domain-containing protein [Patescibacteria group bacterium]